MKPLLASFLLLVAVPSYAAVVSDPFADASHTNTTGGDASGAVWFRNATTSSALSVVDDSSVVPASKALALAATTSQRGMLAFFPSQTLAAGQTLTLEFEFRFTSAPQNLAQSFMLGLFDSAGTQQTADADSTTRLDDRGYGLVTNVGANSATGTRVFLERTGNDILGGTGVVFPAGGVNGASFSCGTTQRHHARLSVTRLANGSVVLEAQIDTGASASATVTTVTDQFYTFDMLALSNSTAIESFLIDDVKVSLPSPPTVAITSPAADAVMNAPGVIQITANAADTSAVVKVEFFRGTTKLGEDMTAPFSFDWISPGPGVHGLTAVATDDDGDRATSVPVDIRVTGGVPDEFDTLRARWSAIITGGNTHDLGDSDIASRVAGINGAAQSNWNSLWSDMASANNAAHTSSSFSRLSAMALAYVTNGCALKGDAAILADIIAGLEWMNANRYGPAFPISTSDWYLLEVTAPQHINNICTLLYDALTPSQLMRQMRAIEHATPDPTIQQQSGTTTGPNRAEKCHLVTVRGILVKDAATLVLARDSLGAVFPAVTASNGFYADGSFIFHQGLVATATYGVTLLDALNNSLALTDNSTWSVTDPSRANLFGWITSGYEPLMFRGAMMDMAAGRSIARTGSTDHVNGHEFLTALLDTATYASPADALTFRRIAKAHIVADTARSFVNNASLPTLVRAKAVLNDNAITPQPEAPANRQFAGSARAVHRGAGFAFGVSMSSNRVFNYEGISGENLQGWHTGDGATYLYNSELDSYSDAYWPTVNRKRLAGTTVDSQTLANNADQSTFGAFSWAGGAELLGLYGATGMELDARSSTLTARKSWFQFDDEIVALGTGITSTDNRTIETIVENRRLQDAASTLTVDGAAKPASLGWSETMTGIGWAHLAATGGYIFHGGATVKGLREARTGSWSEIHSAGPTTTITRNYATLWLDHGANPINGTYAYTILPGKSAAQTAAYAVGSDIVILENTTAAHGVREQQLGITAANFWNDGAHTTGIITSDRKSSVLVRESPTKLEVAVSDPTQHNSGIITIELARSAVSVASSDPEITVTQLSPTVRFTANVNGKLGRALKVTFNDTPLNAWKHAHFAGALGQSGDLLDPDSDGTVNLLEYATGGDPNTPSPSVVLAGNDGSFFITYTESLLASDVTFTVEVSTDLIHWQPATVTRTILSSTATTQLVRAEEATPVGSSQRFLRLHIAVP